MNIYKLIGKREKSSLNNVFIEKTLMGNKSNKLNI